MCTAGFPEPWTFSLRARRLLAARRGEFDLVHDNQCLGNGILGMIDDGWPLLTTLHHPITVDRQLALSHASNPWQYFTQRRWFGFLRMQVRVAAPCPGWSPCPSRRRRTSPPRWGWTRPDDRGAGRGRPHRVPAARRRRLRCPAGSW